MWLMGFALLAAGLALVGAALLWLGQRRRRATGLPTGEVVYSDTGAWEKVEAPLRSRRYGLVGRPDYLVKTAGAPTPVEVKSRRSPGAPLASHTLQLGAYCLLVEDHFGPRPAHGLIRYADATFQVPFTEELRAAVLAAAAEIRAARTAPEVHRQHDDPARCRACGYRQACGTDALG